MTQATTGPYFRDKLTVYALQESGDPRCPMVNRWSAHVQSAPGTPDDELEAVAVLFEAAPDLLAACKDARDELNRLQGMLDHDEDHDSIERVVAGLDTAIAKAEGAKP